MKKIEETVYLETETLQKYSREKCSPQPDLKR